MKSRHVYESLTYAKAKLLTNIFMKPYNYCQYERVRGVYIVYLICLIYKHTTRMNGSSLTYARIVKQWFFCP